MFKMSNNNKTKNFKEYGKRTIGHQSKIQNTHTLKKFNKSMKNPKSPSNTPKSRKTWNIPENLFKLAKTPEETTKNFETRIFAKILLLKLIC